MNIRGLAVVALLVAGCAGAPASPTPTPTLAPTPTAVLSPTAAPSAISIHDLTGTLVLTADPVDLTLADGGCAGTGAYDDIRNGTDVSVKDESGTILAVGRLVWQSMSDDFSSCTFTFRVRDVPGAKFYSVQVGSRNALVFPYAQLSGQGWSIDLSLGS